MPLGLHQNCRSRLSELLAENLPNVEVKHGIFLDRLSLSGLFRSDEILPKSGAVRDKLEKYIGENPFVEFVYSYLSTFLAQMREYSAESDGKSIFVFDDVSSYEQTAKDIVESFNALPWTYTFSFGLPDHLSGILEVGENELVLSKNARMIRFTKEMEEIYPLTTGEKKVDDVIHKRGILSIFDPEWRKDQIYFQVQIEGYVGRYGFTQTANDANAIVKSFFGVCIALNIFNHKYVYFPSLNKNSYFVHRFVKGRGWTIDNTLDFEDGLNKGIQSSFPADFGADDSDKKLAWKYFRHQLPQVRSVIGNIDGDGKKIATASQWLFESLYGESELLSFVQAIVVLEILLGDKAVSDVMGLSEMLRNRCAYLIGTTRKERDELLVSFGEIYKVRSFIVHRGKRNLTNNERILFQQLLWMCGRVIQEETKLLANSS